jgi:hypothetical protein
MKLLVLALVLISGMAQAKSSTLEFNGTVTGTVKFQTKWTATCLAIGCPPSRAYTQISLVNANVEGYGTVAEVNLEDKSLKNLTTPVSFVVIKGTRIRPGLKVKIKGDIWLRKYSFQPLEYVVIQSADSVKVVR